MVKFDNDMNNVEVLYKSGLNPNWHSIGMNIDGIRRFSRTPGSVYFGHGIDKLSNAQLRGLIVRASMNFKANPDLNVSYESRFARCLVRECDQFRNAQRLLSPVQVAEFRKIVEDTNMSICDAAKVSREHFEPCVTSEYSGFNNLTMDDDFICLKKGGLVVSVIALPGNDYNLIKNYLREAGDKCLSATNIDDFRLCLKRYRQDKALKLCENKGISKKRALSLMDNK